MAQAALQAGEVADDITGLVNGIGLREYGVDQMWRRTLTHTGYEGPFGTLATLLGGHHLAAGRAWLAAWVADVAGGDLLVLLH